MNSSTNPPKQAHKFQFGADFTEEEERARLEALRQEAAQQEVEQVPPAPVFSEDDLTATREDAFRQGVEQGRAEARDAIENTLSGLLNVVSGNLEALVAHEEERLQRMQELVLRTTIATLKKVWPVLMQNNGLAMVENTVRQSLEYNPEESRIVIRVHDTMLDPLIKRLPQIQEQQAFSGKVIVLSDQGVGVGDCKVEWADGGMERLSRNLSAQLDLALERVLASIKSNSQNADTERTSQ